MSYDNDALRTESPPNEAQFVRLDGSYRLIHAALGLSSEVGEFCDPIKKFVYYGKPIDETNLKEELGDLLWYIAIAADALGTTIEQLQATNIAKLRARFPERFTEQDAIVRDLDAERVILEGTS